MFGWVPPHLCTAACTGARCRTVCTVRAPYVQVVNIKKAFCTEHQVKQQEAGTSVIITLLAHLKKSQMYETGVGAPSFTHSNNKIPNFNKTK